MSIIKRINTSLPLIIGDNMVECIAGEDITFGTVVIKDADNKVYIADIYNETHAHRVLGIATDNVSINDPIVIQVTKLIKNTEWDFEFKKPVYVSDYGRLTQTSFKNGFIQMVGIPYEINSLYIDIDQPILFDFYKPNIVVNQSQIMVSKNQYIEFSCLNIGYSYIEWKVLGKSYNILGGLNAGPDLKNISISWNSIGTVGVKVRIKNATTNLWSAWSKLYTAEVL
jgi:hypothetical protein